MTSEDNRADGDLHMPDSSSEDPAELDEARFATNMRNRRMVLGWSQGELARRLRDSGWTNFHQTTVSRIENRERPIRLGEARGIASILNTKVDVLTQAPTNMTLSQTLHKATEMVVFSLWRVRTHLPRLKQYHQALQREVSKAVEMGFRADPSDTVSHTVEGILHRAQRVLNESDPRQVTEEALAQSDAEEEARDGEHPEAP